MLYSVLKPLLFRLDAERAHELTTALLAASGRVAISRAILRAAFAYDDPTLRVDCAGLHFANPFGMAAGFDKRGVLVTPLGLLGFGHVEVGTVTPRAQPGNPQPRMFRLPEDSALINRLGFNSPGMVVVAQNLRRQETRRHRDTETRAQNSKLKTQNSPVVGINIGKNRDTPLERAAEDYLAAYIALAPQAQYLTLNISSPNTPGLRRLHERNALEQLLATLVDVNRTLAHPRPLFLKISPDESAEHLDDVIAAALGAGIAGLIASNTTLSRNGLRSSQPNEAGGLSGAPLTLRARATIAQLYRATNGRLPLIGVGGVASAEDAYRHIRAGATLVQLYTGLVYQGPSLVRDLKRTLSALLKRDGFTSVADAVGIDAEK